MNDLFPDTLRPEAIGFDAIRYVAPVFFALYPSAQDLPRVAAWQRRVCHRFVSNGLVLRPARLLHISVALCGTPRRQRQPLHDALRQARERFDHPAFDITLVATTGFGDDGRAFVALADQAGTRAVHGLRIALADAQKVVGLDGPRAASAAHLTLGYGEGGPDGCVPVEPIRFHVDAVDLVASHVGHSRHEHLDRWPLE